MRTYTKRLNIIDYTVMGLLSVNVILVALGIPHALTCFITLWVLSIGVFIITSLKSKIHRISVPLFILDLFCKIYMYVALIFSNDGDPSKKIIDISFATLLIGFLISVIIDKKIPIYRPVSYLLIYGVTTGICAAITM